MGFLKPKVDAPQVQQAPPVPPLAMTTDKRPKRKPMTPTVLGQEQTPGSLPQGGNTLLGQA